ncbi:MAG: hypothetical protein FJ276_11125 [Planctomycetes bacterium]|nr:hypothetical protein [Planctomycetota bacterium]
MHRQLAYCTNVHAGADLAATTANLRRHSLAVKRQFSPHGPMGVGLWLAAPAARQLNDRRSVTEFAQWLGDQGLVPFTFNGFPYGDFHQPVVKYRVYQPTWFDRERLDYTIDLIDVLDACLPSAMEGSISTLPIAWREPRPSAEQMLAAARQVCRVAEYLGALESRTGRLIYLCLEPEPGCVLQVADDVVRFFDEHLMRAGDERLVRRHVRVCHDICHAAVMFEDQRAVLAKYARHGIRVGKVQVSSAIRVDLASIAREEQEAALAALAAFAEDRYLHQTAIRESAEAPPRLFDDLPGQALDAIKEAVHRGSSNAEGRVHFHVPIFLERFGAIATTQDQIRQCLDAAREESELRHFEVETYAWGVLPAQLRCAELADGIARELQWLAALLTP